MVLINIAKVDDRYRVTFAGKRHQFDDYINKVMSVEDKSYHFETKSWVFDENGIKTIRNLFQVPEKPSAIPATIKKQVSGYEGIGQSMKLQPYEYQKEAIKYILDTKEALLILPCGAGKSATGIGAYLELKERGEITGPGVIIVKASLKYQWHKEVEKFSNLRSKVVLSSKEVAMEVKARIDNREEKVKNLKKSDELVQKLKKEMEELQKESALTPFSKSDAFKDSEVKYRAKNKLNKAKLTAEDATAIEKLARTAIKRKLTNLNKKLENLSDKEGVALQIKTLQKEIIALKKEAITMFQDQFKDADLFVLNYETLLEQDVRQQLRKAKIEYIFADEVQYIKSKDAKRSKAVSEFSDIPYKIGATATPVGKNPEDLFGIFRFVAPETFPKWSNFAALYIKYAGFGKIAGFKNLEKLREKIAPSLFVKSKEEVASFLPKLVVMQRYCEFEPAQREVHASILAKIDELRDQEDAIRAKFKSEKDAFNNPALAKVEALILAHQTFAQQLANSEELFALSDSEMASQFVTGAKSNKMETLVELVEEILSSGEKVAIYSRFKKMQDLIVKRFAKEFPDVGIAQIHGELSGEQRYEEAYTKFRDNDHYKILLSSNAGAEGINLSECKYLIEIEPAESYAIETQRHGRLERSDSIHDTVFVYQLICNDSWDEVALKIISKKQTFDIELIRKE